MAKGESKPSTQSEHGAPKALESQSFKAHMKASELAKALHQLNGAGMHVIKVKRIH